MSTHLTVTRKRLLKFAKNTSYWARLALVIMLTSEFSQFTSESSQNKLPLRNDSIGVGSMLSSERPKKQKNTGVTKMPQIYAKKRSFFHVLFIFSPWREHQCLEKYFFPFMRVFFRYRNSTQHRKAVFNVKFFGGFKRKFCACVIQKKTFEFTYNCYWQLCERYVSDN